MGGQSRLGCRKGAGLYGVAEGILARRDAAEKAKAKSN